MDFLILVAKALFEKGKSIEEVREYLRGILMGEDFPTCSAVEEAIRIAQVYFLSNSDYI